MGVFFYIAYGVVGLIQLFAIADGISYGIGIEGFFSFLLAFIVTYIPILGALCGIYGAVTVWDWGLLQAVLLFFWFIPVALMLMILDRR